MEEEIDLSQYIDVLIRWWWLIALGAVVVGGVAFLVSMILPPTYEARAGVVMLKSKVELSLGSGFQSVADTDLGFTEAAAQSQALIERTKQRLNSMLGIVSSGAIAKEVFDEVKDILPEETEKPSDLLPHVSAEIPEDSDTIQIIVSYSDPEVAAAVANAWGRAFEKQVNTIYGEAALSPFADIREQVQTAKTEYERAQEAWVNFLANEDKIDELQRQIEEEEAIIAELRTGRQEDVSTVVDSQVDLQKRLFNTSVASEVSANLAVYEHQKSMWLHEFERNYSRKQDLEDLLDIALLMRQQLVDGDEAGAATTGLALLAFKSRVFGTASGLPFEKLELQMESVDGLSPNRSVEEQLADLDGLIAAMREEIDNLDAAIEEQTNELDQRESFSFLESLTPEQLDVADAPSGQMLQRMKDWQGVLSYSSLLNESLTQEIEQLEEHVRYLKSEVVRLSGLKDTLKKERDLAWSAYNNLLSKEQEIEVATATEGTEVRFASPALPPAEPASPKRMLNTAVGLALGLMMGVFGAFLFDYLGMESKPRQFWKQVMGKA